MSTKINCDMYRIELLTAWTQACLDGDAEGAEMYRQMLEDFEENMEDFE